MSMFVDYTKVLVLLKEYSQETSGGACNDPCINNGTCNTTCIGTCNDTCILTCNDTCIGI